VFTSGVVLLLHVWGGKRFGLALNKSKGMEDVHKCIQVLKDQEDRWHSGGRYCNLLYGLASAGNITFPDDPPPRNKRERDAGSATSTSTPLSDYSSPWTPERPRSIAGPWRELSKKASPLPTAAPTDGHVPQPDLSTFILPMNSHELGRLPVYSPFDFQNYPGLSPLKSLNNDTWESAVGHVPPFDPNLSSHIPPTVGNAQDMDDLFYDQMASVFSGWKGPVPELPYEQPTPYQFNASQAVLPMDEGHITMPLYTDDTSIPSDLPPGWDGSHNWNSTYSSLQGGNDGVP
jgi:hypothetical protein